MKNKKNRILRYDSKNTNDEKKFITLTCSLIQGSVKIQQYFKSQNNNKVFN